jgi:hypothetical protein
VGNDSGPTGDPALLEATVILHVNYEEVRALRTGARTLLGREPGASASPVLAPSETRARVEELEERLQGDLALHTLDELQDVEAAVETIVRFLRSEMEAKVVATHPAGEQAVAAYFDFAHALAVGSRLAEVGDEMRAVIELATGRPADAEAERSFQFPD